MAFWNAPCENHAEMAVKTAMEIELLGDELEKEMEQRGLPKSKIWYRCKHWYMYCW